MADMGVTETVAVGQVTVSQSVQMYLQEQAKLMDKVSLYTAGKGETSIKIGRAGGFTVQDKAENSAVTAQVITYAADTLALDQHKVIQVRLEDIANIQARPDIINDILLRMGKDMAYKLDQLIVSKLEAASAAAPDHRLAYANAATLGAADILAARELLQLQYIPFQECWIGVSPGSENDLLAITNFISADVYGSSAGLVNGEIGRLYGARVVMSAAFADLKTIVWHPSAVAFGMQREPNFRSMEDLPNLAMLYSVDALYGAVTLDSGKRQVMLGTAA